MAEKYLIVGYNAAEEETCIDYLADPPGPLVDPDTHVMSFVALWERIRKPQGFEMVANWSEEDLQRTLGQLKSQSIAALLTEFQQMELPNMGGEPDGDTPQPD